MAADALAWFRRHSIPLVVIRDLIGRVAFVVYRTGTLQFLKVEPTAATDGLSG